MNYDTLPAGFSLYRTLDLNTNKLKLWLSLAQLPMLAAPAVPMAFIVPLGTQVPFSFDALGVSPGKYFALSMSYLAVMMAGIFGILLVHELIHGLCFKFVAGGKPKYGHKLPFYLYAACENRYICKKHYYVIALAPLAVLTALLALVCVLTPQSWFWVPYFVLIMNACGCTGDIYVAFLLTRIPKDALMIDSGVAMQIFSKQGAEQ